MSGPKQTAGYPSRTAAVIALRADGLTPKEIAARCGISERAVAALEATARRRVGKPVRFPVDVLVALKPHAVARGLTTEELIRDLVSTVAREAMVDAVLDDDSGPRGDGDVLQETSAPPEPITRHPVGRAYDSANRLRKTT